ncbi:putative aspartic-type endopeptidase opsB [Fusarium culmorum]|uniref:Putative aspartic-type endopeptidase opsB n=1 Tax=Fusarium culmorum TaxID=5516 RepID=A0A2T4GTJ1_FUSCU|nr:putative aspartic-type endopeptidase opsB [Fusarium culmorum]
MLSTLFLAVAAPALATAFNAPNVPVGTDDSSPDGLIRFPLKVSTGAPVVKGVTKRQNEVALESQQNGFFYSIDVTLGTPGQKVTVNLDTGSAELWVNPVCEKAQQPAFCKQFGHFGESSTFVDLNTTGGVVYGTGYAYWNYGYDNVVVGSAAIRNQVFGVAYDSSFTGVGIMGAGPDLNGWDAPYPLVIDSMVKQGLIKSRALSLDIRTINSDRGAVIFGAPHHPRRILPDGLTRYWVSLDGISLVQEDGTVDSAFSGSTPQPVLLDSGYTVSALPGSIFNKIVAAFPTAKSNGGAYVDVDCSVADIKGSVDFKFGDKTIKVPYADFIWHNDERCVLGVFQDDEFPVLGDTFLRAAYVVYDWDNRNVWIANNEDCGTNLVAIGTGPDAVPDLVGQCGSDSETTTSASETASATETETETETASATESEAVTATTEDVTSAETDTTTGYFPTTRYSNSTASVTGKGTSTTKKATGGSGESYELPSYTDSSASTTITSTVVTSKVYTVTACPPASQTALSAKSPLRPSPLSQPTVQALTILLLTLPQSKARRYHRDRAQHADRFARRTHWHLHHPEAIQCGAGNFGCKEATTKGYRTVTITPVVKAPKPTPVPGYCATCGPLKGHGHHNNDDDKETATGGYTAPGKQTGGYDQPTQAHPGQDYPRPTGDSHKPTGDSDKPSGDAPKPNPLEELQTYRPTNVFPRSPQALRQLHSPVAINGASGWNVPVVAAVVVGAFVAAL